ncbi:MAG TPA: alanine racemase [Nocardioidaceae bacterium]|nr:alanine racemase [Nocardioidaceae bacterium]
MSQSDVGSDLPTPCLIIDVSRLRANVEAMAAHARRIGTALRPHAKTHKSPAIAALQRGAGAQGLTVATVSEAEVFASAGFTDLFIAYPVWVDRDRGRRLAALRERARVIMGIDSAESARALAAQLPGTSVLVEVDSGHHRSGVLPDGAGELAEQAARSGVEVRGVFTFPGHAYSPGVQQQVVLAEQHTLETASASLRRHGIEPTVVSGGSTPTAAGTAPGAMNEIRPGVYVFGDAQQWELGTVEPADIALTCSASVVSRAGGNVVLDSGSKILGADRAPWATGHGRLLDHPDARIHQLSEHHAVVSWPEHTPPPGIGEHVRVVPNHVCNAVNLVDELVVVKAGTVVDRWPVAARGALT